MKTIAESSIYAVVILAALAVIADSALRWARRFKRPLELAPRSERDPHWIDPIWPTENPPANGQMEGRE